MKRYIKSSIEDKLYALVERHVDAYLDSMYEDQEIEYSKLVDYVYDMVLYNLREKYGYEDIDTQRLYKQVAMIIDDNWEYWSE